MAAFDIEKLRVMPKRRLDALLARAYEVPQHPHSAQNIRTIGIAVDEQRRLHLTKSLADALVSAFEEDNPTSVEIECLKLIFLNPGADAEELARLSKHQGPGKHQIVIGAMCRRYAHFLPEPPYAHERNDDFWSGIVCELTPKQSASGRVTFGWTLKAGTVEALRRCGYI